MKQKEREAMKAALEALEWSWGGEPLPSKEYEAMQLLRAALAEQDVKQEPVAWCWKVVPDGLWHYGENCPPPPYESFPLYTAQPRRELQGLTEEEIEAAIRPLCGENELVLRQLLDFSMDEYRAIESKLKEKNHG